MINRNEIATFPFVCLRLPFSGRCRTPLCGPSDSYLVGASTGYACRHSFLQSLTSQSLFEPYLRPPSLELFNLLLTFLKNATYLSLHATKVLGDTLLKKIRFHYNFEYLWRFRLSEKLFYQNQPLDDPFDSP